MSEDEPGKGDTKPVPPGEYIRDEIFAELGLSIARAAEILGVPRAAVYDVVNGKGTLSPEMALRLEKAFGASMESLLQMQAAYDSYTMRQRAGEIRVARYRPES